MSEEPLLFECRDGIATLTLNAPRKLNPLSLDVQRRLRTALAQVRDDRSVRALVLTGMGRAFSVGADLATLEQDATAAAQSRGQWVGDAMTELTNPLIQDLRGLPVPTLAAVNGVAAGASVGLALACDIAIAARSAGFVLPFVPRLGLVPDAGISWFLPRLVGPARAMGTTLLGDRISAEQAAQWGLVWACVDDADHAATVRSTAERLAALPAHAALEARQLLQASLYHDLDQQLKQEAARQRVLIERDPFAEGMRAFLDKRPPTFGGR